MSDMARDPLQEREMIRAALLGHAVGDALGVPVEFCSRKQLRRDPVSDLRAYGTHNQPAGTWSDDTSLTLCTAEALCEGGDLRAMAGTFERWMFEQHWTPHGEVFDIGQTTREAIFAMSRVDDPRDAGPADELSNGNGSLMRILPVALYWSRAHVEERRRQVMDSSRLTHGHIRSQLACAMYAELVAELLHGRPFGEALASAQQWVRRWIDRYDRTESQVFQGLLNPSQANFKPREISGSGYVIDCLLASLWCCANTNSYEAAVLRAVNLGDDTDTTAAVTGGLAALIHGPKSVPRLWVDRLARREEVGRLYERFAEACLRYWKEPPQ